MDKKIKNFRDLRIWQNSMDLISDIYSSTRTFPKDEIYGLVTQIRRAAVSIASNIAEGFSRYHKKEYIHFLYIALGSCSELATQIEISSRLDFISLEMKKDILDKIDHISRMITKLIKTIVSQKRTTNCELRAANC